jgi:hypothetical protein
MLHDWTLSWASTETVLRGTEPGTCGLIPNIRSLYTSSGIRPARSWPFILILIQNIWSRTSSSHVQFINTDTKTSLLDVEGAVAAVRNGTSVCVRAVRGVAPQKQWAVQLSWLTATLWTVNCLIQLKANHKPNATACRRSNCQLLRIEGAKWSAWRIPTAVFSVF